MHHEDSCWRCGRIDGKCSRHALPEAPRIELDEVGKETIIHWNGPPIHLCDSLGEKVMNRHFKGRPWHFVTKASSQSTVIKRLLEKNPKVPFFWTSRHVITIPVYPLFYLVSVSNWHFCITLLYICIIFIIFFNIKLWYHVSSYVHTYYLFSSWQ